MLIDGGCGFGGSIQAGFDHALSRRVWGHGVLVIVFESNSDLPGLALPRYRWFDRFELYGGYDVARVKHVVAKVLNERYELEPETGAVLGQRLRRPLWLGFGYVSGFWY